MSKRFLKDTLKGLDVKIYGNENIEISSISDNSEHVYDGCLFVAVKGRRTDAHSLIPKVLKKGAKVIVGERKPKKSWYKNTTYVQVKNSRRSLSLIAGNYYGNPSKRMKLIGVTGTKGKTTTSFYIFQIMQSMGLKVGLVSSVGAYINSKCFETGLHVTNPEPLVLQKLISDMVKLGAEYLVLEVTSHGLDQERVFGLEFDVGILTNISHEHLDYHETMQNYMLAKAKLLESSRTVILNRDDDGFGFYQKLVKSKNLFTFGKNKNSDVRLLSESERGSKTTFVLKQDNNNKTFKTQIAAGFNRLNLVAAITVVWVITGSWKKIRTAVSEVKNPPGRLQKVKHFGNFNIYIDFAHTPASLESALNYLRKKTKKRLICVFGCAGERDVQKRPVMADISTRLADISIFTAEDPRSESVTEIIDQMCSGVFQKAKEVLPHEYAVGKRKSYEKVYMRIPERNEAVVMVLTKIANDGDTVVFCGKGHEKSMAYGGVEHPWSDKAAIENALKLDMKKAAIVLAAGKGRRMESSLPKVLHKIAGKPLIAYSLAKLRSAGFGQLVAVVGYKRDLIIERVQGPVAFTVQDKQLGTGDALNSGLTCLSDNTENVLVVNGDDSAFYQPSTLNKIFSEHVKNCASVTLATMTVNDPTGLGRIKRGKNGEIRAVVEENVATDKDKKIKEVNIGLYVFNIKWARDNVGKIKKSKVGEYYIVDLVDIAVRHNGKVRTVKIGDNKQWIGVNTRKHLEVADRRMRRLVKLGK
jgi:UDP-N-acetylmuramoyl-L-alanyl-D-glutamate--2,6-diaminopimelate ligase